MQDADKEEEQLSPKSFDFNSLKIQGLLPEEQNNQSFEQQSYEEQKQKLLEQRNKLNIIQKEQEQQLLLQQRQLDKQKQQKEEEEEYDYQPNIFLPQSFNQQSINLMSDPKDLAQLDQQSIQKQFEENLMIIQQLYNENQEFKKKNQILERQKLQMINENQIQQDQIEELIYKVEVLSQQQKLSNKSSKQSSFYVKKSEQSFLNYQINCNNNKDDFNFEEEKTKKENNNITKSKKTNKIFENQPKMLNPINNESVFQTVYQQNQLQNQKNKIRVGEIVQYDNSLFQDISKLYNNCFNAQDINNFNRLKLACLKKKHSVYENNIIQVGSSCSLQNTNGATNLVIMLFFGNKSQNQDITNLQSKYSGDSNISLWSKPSQLQENIEAKHQIKQELISQFNNLPFKMLQLKLNYFTSNPEQSFQINHGIPVSFNKFFEEKHMTEIQFKSIWKQLKQYPKNILVSTEFELNEKISENIYDIKKIFRNIIDLSHSKEYLYLKGQSDYKLGNYLFKIQGCVFKLNSQFITEIYFKFIACINKKVQFQCGIFNHQYLNIAKYLMQTFIFLFKIN